jgi:hypothetical protein
MSATSHDGQADLLQELVAASATFRTLTGESTVAAAKKHVALAEAQDEDDDESSQPQKLDYPRAIVSDGGIVDIESTSFSDTRGTGSLFLSFEFEVPKANRGSMATKRTWFVTKVSTIIEEMWTVSKSRATPSGYSTSHLQLLRTTRVNGPGEYGQDEVEPHEDGSPRFIWAMEYEVTY